MCAIGYRMVLCILLMILTVSHCSYSNKISVEKKEIITRIEGEVKLICSSEQEKTACIFTSPSGQSYNMLKGNAYDDLRIQAYETEKNLYDCAMMITSVKQNDTGTWKCNVTTTIPFYQIGTNSIKVIIQDGGDITSPMKGMCELLFYFYCK